MTAETPTQKRVCCPDCGQKGKRVRPITLQALLQEEQARAAENNADAGWRFCESRDCEVAYFSEASATTFTKSDIKVAVGVKETTGERPLCYCFGHSVSSIKDELRTQGRSAALEDIRTKIKTLSCRCETENPAGACCLASVSKGIKIAQKELQRNETDIETPAAPGDVSTGRGERIAKVGTVASAIMASACCWLPLVLLTAGVSGAGMATTLEAYRPLFSVLTFGFLGAAFYFTYRPSKLSSGNGASGCCVPGPTNGKDCCAPAAKGRFKLRNMNKVMLWAVTAMAAGFLLFPSYVGVFLGGHAGRVSNDMNRAVFKIEGMTCEGCSALVGRAVQTAPGVLAVEVDYRKGEAVVGVATSIPIPRDEILAALLTAGYKGEEIAADANSQAERRKPTAKPDSAE